MYNNCYLDVCRLPVLLLGEARIYCTQFVGQVTPGTRVTTGQKRHGIAQHVSFPMQHLPFRDGFHCYSWVGEVRIYCTQLVGQVTPVYYMTG